MYLNKQQDRTERNQASYWRLYKGGQFVSLGVGFFSASYTKDLKTQNLKLSLVAPSFPPPLLKIYFNLGYIFSEREGLYLLILVWINGFGVD